MIMGCTRAFIALAGLAAAAGVKVGDLVPDIDLDYGFPPEKVNLKKYCAGKRIVLVGLPGAFTPT